MYVQVEKLKENKSRAVANSVTQKHNGSKQEFGFVDNRPAFKTQRTLQRNLCFAPGESGSKNRIRNNIDQPIQLVKAYRVQYVHNKKIGEDIPITAPIDISFEFDFHSEYFLRERSEAQQEGLEVVSWDMDDDWWDAVLDYAHIKLGRLSRKVQGIVKRFTEQNLPRPSISDGQECPKYIRQRALHFQAKWQSELRRGLTGNISVRDIQRELAEQQAERIQEEFGEAASVSVGGMVDIQEGDDESTRMSVTREEFESMWQYEGYQIVEN
jgi:hypothetical protein